MVAGTRDGRLACKLDLLKGRSPGSVEPDAGLELLRQQREAIEAEIGLGPLNWGGQSSSRVYLYHDSGLSERRAWSGVVCMTSSFGRWLMSDRRHSICAGPSSTPT